MLHKTVERGEASMMDKTRKKETKTRASAMEAGGRISQGMREKVEGRAKPAKGGKK